MQHSSRVLIIEDNDEQAFLLQHWFEGAGGYEVVRAEDGVAGARFAAYGEWDLVVSDIDLPGLSGLDLIQRIKARDPNTPVLLITAHERMDYALEAIQHRADAFQLKPLQQDTFMTKAAELIATAKQNRTVGQDVVLAIGAHPDDVEIGCGGTLRRHRHEGDTVAILTLSGGEEGGEPGMRMQESQHAADLLGARLFIENLPDTAISEGLETIAVIERVIREVQPTKIYTHTLNDAHQDHRNTHKATVVAARSVPNVYCYQAPSTTVDFRPNLFIDVSPYMQQKLNLIAAYRSQTQLRAYLEDDLVEATARYWGRFAGYSRVEPMEVMRQRA